MSQNTTNYRHKNLLFYVFIKMIKLTMLHTMKFDSRKLHKKCSFRTHYIRTFGIHGGPLFYTELENSSLLTIGEIWLYRSFLTTLRVICLQVTMIILRSISTFCCATVRNCICCKKNEMKSAETSTSQTVSILNTPCWKRNKNTALQKSVQ